MVGRIGVGVACGGLATADRERRRRLLRAAALRRSGAEASGSGSFTEASRSYLGGPLEARKGGEGGFAVRWCSAAAMAWAAAFQGQGSGGGARFGVERKGEEREHGVAKQNGEERAVEGSSAVELRRRPWRAAGGVRRSWARARRNGSRRGRGVERGCENGSWEGN